ncbi:MAG: hypothetical protein KJZ91_16870 [Myxococcales bacterium]|nr:hypothetical protein [Myxococcales bacterium]
MIRALLVGLLVGLLGAATACNVNPYNLAGDGGGGGSGDGGGGGDGGGDGDGGIDAPDDAPTDAGCVPRPETCNEADDDCDGMIDEGFNLDADPRNCGTCGNRCQYDNAIGVCNGGDCEQGDCRPGWNDTDPGAPGCEYFCIPTNGGVEVCDDRDNDCDNAVDEDFDLDDDVNNCGRCGHVCNLLHATAACNGGDCEVASCDPGFVDLNPAVPGCEYQCTPTNGGVEACDGVDNDCDGVVDDGNPGGGQPCGTDTGECSAGTFQCSNGVLFCVGAVGGTLEVCDGLDNDCDGVEDDGFDKQNDPQHCGGCSPCVVPFAVAGCALGACTVASCDFGRHDLNGLPGDGCEYACIPTGVEVCDNRDNDCDGTIDEGIDTTSDPNNCGTCGRTCSFANAGATCVNSDCELGACNPNFYDLDGLPGNGCEYGCVLTNGGVEACDALDNDCDGVVNDGNPGGGVACGTDVGACATGLTTCSGGTIVCVGDVGPVAETCNNVDDDCNGVVDNGYDKLNDPRYCNDCAGCNLPNAVAGCAGGACTVAGCYAGWVDLDGLPGNGCEYSCTFSGQEVCDGVDNDCDGLVDAADPGILTPANFCRQQGECAGTTPTCTGAAGWDCVYTDPDVELQGNGDPVLEESRCDGLDNDCDGAADEVFPLKGTACAEDGTFGTSRKLGICRGTGALVCNAAQTGLACNVTAPGATPTNETCNNRDDDCDGHVDEPFDANALLGVRDVRVGPLTVNGQSVVMYRYEASRPDATAANPGFIESRACSVAGRLPWAGGDYAEVRTACEKAGMRLCRVTRNAGGAVTSDEWGRFCEGPANRVFPYGNTYSPTACNGSDYDPVPGGVNEDHAIPTGNLATCEAQDLSRDQSGNLKEWVDDPRIVSGQLVHTLRGGSFDNHRDGLTCDFDLTVVPTSYIFPNTGFRCCALNCAAGSSECGGTCVNWATSNQHCGGCGRACGAGTACSNGYCCPTGTRACGDVCVPNATPCP